MTSSGPHRRSTVAVAALTVAVSGIAVSSCGAPRASTSEATVAQVGTEILPSSNFSADVRSETQGSSGGRVGPLPTGSASPRVSESDRPSSPASTPLGGAASGEARPSGSSSTQSGDIHESGETPSRSSSSSESPQNATANDESSQNDENSQDVDKSGPLTSTHYRYEGRGLGLDWAIPTKVPKPTEVYSLGEKGAWLKANGTKLGHLNSFTLINAGERTVAVESMQSRVTGRAPLGNIYCARSYPHGGAGINPGIHFDLERGKSWGIPEASVRGGATWSFPLTIEPGDRFNFSSLDTLAGMDVSYYVAVTYTYDTREYTLSVGSPEYPFRTSSCKGNPERYHWRAFDAGPNSLESVKFEPLEQDWDPNPFR